MKRKFIKTYDDLVTNYYGEINKHKKKNVPKSAGIILAKSFDYGEVLSQKPGRVIQKGYGFQNSVSDAVFEEYVVDGEVMSTEKSLEIPVEEVSVNQEYEVEVLNPSDDSRQSSQQAHTMHSPSHHHNEPNEFRSQMHSQSENISEEQSTKKASDDDFISDMQEILSGQKVFDPLTKQIIEKEKLVQSQSESNKNLEKENPITEFKNEHTIFDKIAQSMQYANAYDLGSVNLDKKFSDFDKISDIQKSITEDKKKISKSSLAEEFKVDSKDFIEDLDTIKKKTIMQETQPEQNLAESYSKKTLENNENLKQYSNQKQSTEISQNNTNWPTRPTNIRPYTSQERINEFSDFQFETVVDQNDPSIPQNDLRRDEIRILNNWESQNIVRVNIPQLNRIMNNNGSIRFHQLGVQRLQNLWHTWETAGLLDRILTFDGGFVARFIRSTSVQQNRPRSNHSWGTAFDINAEWNGFGNEPALLGHQGCVRELVSIANQNGFYWGGHFNHKDGMHFELCHILI